MKRVSVVKGAGKQIGCSEIAFNAGRFLRTVWYVIDLKENSGNYFLFFEYWMKNAVVDISLRIPRENLSTRNFILCYICAVTAVGNTKREFNIVLSVVFFLWNLIAKRSEVIPVLNKFCIQTSTLTAQFAS